MLERLTSFLVFQRLLGVGRIPAAPTLDELLATAASPRLLVALDGLASSENVAGLVRTASAFGADGIIAGETSASPWLCRSAPNFACNSTQVLAEARTPNRSRTCAGVFPV